MEGVQNCFYVEVYFIKFCASIFFFLKKKIVLSSKVVSVLQYCEFVIICRLRILSQWKASVYIDPIGKAKLCTEIRDPRLSQLKETNADLGAGQLCVWIPPEVCKEKTVSRPFTYCQALDLVLVKGH